MAMFRGKSSETGGWNMEPNLKFSSNMIVNSGKTMMSDEHFETVTFGGILFSNKPVTVHNANHLIGLSNGQIMGI
jgi:hypothetical protein